VILRKLSSLALLLSLLDPLGALATSLRARHECGDHVCACRQGARPAARPCHGSGHDGPGMQAACSHDADPVLLRATAPALVTFALSSEVRFAPEAARPNVDDRSRAGFTRIDSPPPRSL
jgi:hypothetical protein